jgi:ribosomal-protein-alanine N-acetyltransferase
VDIPTLTTARLKLRPFTAQDARALHHILHQEGVLRYFPWPEPPSREKVDQFIADQLQRWERDGFGLWAAELRATPGFIGWAGLQNLPETKEVEVGYLLGKAYWGQGLATEAALASLSYGFETLGLQRIVAIVHRGNLASQRVTQKLGMRCDREAEYWGMPAFHYVIESTKAAAPHPHAARANSGSHRGPGNPRRTGFSCCPTAASSSGGSGKPASHAGAAVPWRQGRCCSLPAASLAATYGWSNSNVLLLTLLTNTPVSPADTKRMLAGLPS